MILNFVREFVAPFAVLRDLLRVITVLKFAQEAGLWLIGKK